MTVPRFVSIKTRFVAVALVLVACSSALWGWWAWNTERDLLYHSLQREGRQMLTMLSSPIVNALLYEEMGVIEEGGLLDNFIEEITTSSTLQVINAFVTDQNGKVLAHNKYTEYGKVYDDPMTRRALSGNSFLSLLHSPSKGAADELDMAMPLQIHGKRWGALRVTVSAAPLESKLQQLTQRIVASALLYFLVGGLISYLIGRSMARPLQRLTEAMSSITGNNLTVVLPPDRDDEIGQLQTSFRNMLERLQQSEIERKRAIAGLIQNEKLASIGKIVAGVAHEINNPLGAITTCIYNLEQQPGIQQNRNLALIRQGTERIERIVRQLSDFSRAATLDLQPWCSNHFFNESTEFGRMALKRHDLVLLAEDRCQPPTLLHLDKGKIQQVILNLLLNAADASPPKGRIMLTASSEGGHYRIAVTDQGSGIAQDDREAIFDIFYTTKAAGEGTGIGLAICRSIVELHGGSITFESEPGETVFMVTIPLLPMEGTDACTQTVAD